MKEKLYDIAEVCKMLGTTSRTLRFYEEKGIVMSIKEDFSLRRRYTEKQLEQIRYVLVLRTLGLSVRAIKELQAKEISLESAVLARRAEILASIESRQRELLLLSDALACIQKGETLSIPTKEERALCGGDVLAERCVRWILADDTAALYRHVSPTLAAYMPESACRSVLADVKASLGKLVRLERIKRDSAFPNVVYGYAKYERLGLKIKLVFHGDAVDGLWVTYYETEKETE